MPTVAERKSKAEPQDFFGRLNAHDRKGIQAALTQYRGLVDELSRDPTYEFDPATATELLEVLRLGQRDLQADIEVLTKVRADEATLLSQAALDAMIVESKAASDTIKRYFEEIPQLKGKIRSCQTTHVHQGLLRGEINRTKDANPRLYGCDAGAVQVQVEQAKHTAPKAAPIPGTAPKGMSPRDIARANPPQ